MKVKPYPLRILGLIAFLSLTALTACVKDEDAIVEHPPAGAAYDPHYTMLFVPASRNEVVVIRNNRGGNVLRAIKRRNELERWGGKVEVRGYCGSACTLFITLPNACLGPGAVVGFHAPRIPNTTYIPPGVDDIMAMYYRNGILARWNSTWKRSLEIQKISAREYVRLDPQTKLCR